MSAALDLRRVGARQAWHEWVARWQHEGHSALLCQPLAEARYIGFVAQGPQGSWQGMLAADEWLQAVWPEWSRLLPRGLSDTDLLALFRTVERPMDVPVPALAYERLVDIELVDGRAMAHVALPCIATAQSQLWVRRLPQCQPSFPPRPLQDWLGGLRQPLQAVLGHSLLPPHQLRHLAAGDVLVITEQSRQVLLADQCIGLFTIIEEGLHMQFTDPEAVEQVAPCALSPLPVKLAFVLDERTLSMAELNQLIEHQVLPLSAEAATGVEVRVGGQCIAKGELVQLDDRLGVELLSVYRGGNDE